MPKQVTSVHHTRRPEPLVIATPPTTIPLRKEKGLVHQGQEQAVEAIQFRLEANFQAELHFASIQSAGSLAKVRNWLELTCASNRINSTGGVLVVRSSTCSCENEVRAIENVERICIELQVDPFRYLENLGQSHISSPVARTDKRVAAQVAPAAQAWCRERKVRPRGRDDSGVVGRVW